MLNPLTHQSRSKDPLGMFFLLANPTSGAGRGSAVKKLVVSYLLERGIAFTDISGTSYESARTNLRSSLEKERPEALIVIGGDGMVHLAIQDLAESDIPLLLVPAGTGNDFARSLQINMDSPISCLDHALSSPTVEVDLGRIGSKFFAEILSTGFDSRVNERANRMRLSNRIKYNLAMLLELPIFQPLDYEIIVDEVTFKKKAMLVAIANGASYGGGMRICPDADLSDGLFDVMFLEPVSKFEFIKVFPKVFKGTHISHPKVRIIRGRTVSINARAVAYADGERIGALPVTAEVAPKALRTWIHQ